MNLDLFICLVLLFSHSIFGSEIENTEIITTNDLAITTTTTTAEPCVLEKLVNLPCYYLENVNDQFNLYQKCQSIRSNRIQIIDKNSKTILVDDRKCGVLNNSQVEHSSICFSSVQTQNIKSKFVLRLNLTDEIYYTDYNNIENPKFLAKKLEFELKIGKQLLQSSDFIELGFESFTILTMKEITIINDVPTNVQIETIIMFGQEITKFNFESKWDDIYNANIYLQEILGPNYELLDPNSCQILNDVKSKIPLEIWMASELDENHGYSIGETFNLKCSANKNEDLKFSFDNDSFNAWDDFFTIACSPLQKYNFPTHWPECVKSCKNCLPEAPLHTGLLPVVPPNSIPIGSFGEYVCDDRSLGVMEGPSEYFQVKCIQSDEYDLPNSKYDWPVCMQKSTTISPIISKALNQTIKRRVKGMSDGLQKNRFIDLSVKLKDPENHFAYTTIPWIIILGICVAIVMILSSVNSFICKICSESFNKVEKTMIPLEEDTTNFEFTNIINIEK